MFFRKSTLDLMTITILTCSGLSLATQVPVFAQSSYSSEDYQNWADYKPGWIDYEPDWADYKQDWANYQDYWHNYDWAEYEERSADDHQGKSDTFEDYAADEQHNEDSLPILKILNSNPNL